jgi:hypothetical protein
MKEMNKFYKFAHIITRVTSEDANFTALVIFARESSSHLTVDASRVADEDRYLTYTALRQDTKVRMCSSIFGSGRSACA